MRKLERRAGPRVRFGGAVLVASPSRRLTCAGGDLSDSGMLLFPLNGDATATVGESVEIKFTLPRLYRWVSCEATVVREAIVHERRAWGVAFEDLPPGDREVVRVYVAARQEAQASA